MSQSGSVEFDLPAGGQDMEDSQTRLDDLERAAKSAYRQQAFRESAALYQSAAQILLQHQRIVDAAEMNNNAAVAYLQSGEASAALSLLQGTPKIFAEAGDVRRQALALGNLGMALDSLGKLEEAAAAYEQSSGLLRQLEAFEDRLFVLQALSKVYFRQGKPFLAVTAMRAGVNLLPNPSPRHRLLRWLLKVPDQFMPKPK